MTPPRRTSHRLFDEWPADVQRAFESYYGLEPRDRTLEAACVLAGCSYHQIKRWSSKWGYERELERRNRAEAEETRRKVTATRRKVIEAAEAGLGSLITRYSAAAQGLCPDCMGKGELRVRGQAMADVMAANAKAEGRPSGAPTIPCASCLGTGVYSVMSVSVLRYDKALARFGIMTGDLSDPTDAPRGPITHEEYVERQKAMLELAGAKVAKMAVPITDTGQG